MTVAELRQCAKLATEIEQQDARIKADKARLSTAGAKLQQESAKIDAARSTVNVRDSKAVAAFNARTEALGRQLGAYRTDTDTLNRRIDGYNQMTTSMNVLCAKRPMDDADLAQLTAEERAALTARTTKVLVPTLIGPDATKKQKPLGDILGRSPPPGAAPAATSTDPAAPPPAPQPDPAPVPDATTASPPQAASFAPK